jgi:hypothetical protein
MPLVGAVSGRVWHDRNRNQNQDPGESGLAGVVLTLKQGTTVVATVQSGPDGGFGFGNLWQGQYDVVETDPAGYSSTTPNTVTVTVSPPGTVQVAFGDAVSPPIYLPLVIKKELTH